jgi:hypothetical protein
MNFCLVNNVYINNQQGCTAFIAGPHCPGTGSKLFTGNGTRTTAPAGHFNFSSKEGQEPVPASIELCSPAQRLYKQPAGMHWVYPKPDAPVGVSESPSRYTGHKPRPLLATFILPPHFATQLAGLCILPIVDILNLGPGGCMQLARASRTVIQD